MLFSQFVRHSFFHSVPARQKHNNKQKNKELVKKPHKSAVFAQTITSAKTQCLHSVYKKIYVIGCNKENFPTLVLE